MPPFGLTGVHVRGFRSLKDTSFRPGTIAAIVGEQSAGKLELADGSTISVTGTPPGPSSSEGPARPPARFFPAGLRDGTIAAPPGPGGTPSLIAEVAGEDRVELAPDFEGVAEIHGDRQKPARAWRRFADLGPDAVPAPLAEVVERAMALASRGPG